MGRTIKLQNDTYLANDIYSTDEKVIGMWGAKPLYRKVFAFNLTSNTYTFTSYSLGLSNIEHIYINSASSFIEAGNGQTYQINQVRYQNNTVAYNNEYSWFRINTSGSDINYSIGNTLAGGRCYLCVEYIKTTD